MLDLSQKRLKKLLAYNRRTGMFRWRVNRRRARRGMIAGCIKNRTGYRKIKIDWQIYSASWLVWLYCYGAFPSSPLQIDHINGIRDDNRLKNLRLATISQQAMNRGLRPSSSKYRGVSRCKNKWMAVAGFGGKTKYLGTFKTEKAAAKAYLDYARPICGEFLRA